MKSVNTGSRLQRLVAKTIYVKRETTLGVGGDNVLLVVHTAHRAKWHTSKTAA